MRKLIHRGFTLKINVILLGIVIVAALIYGFFDEEILRNICIATGCVSALLAVGPSFFGYLWEELTRGKPQDVDPDIVVPELRKLCRLMGIEEEIQVKVFPSLKNAAVRSSTLEIGQPLLDKLDSVAMKGVLAHELAHLKESSLKRFTFLIAVIVILVALVALVYQFTPFGSSFFTLLALSFGLMSISFRFITWPFEYEADLIAEKHVGRKAVESCLRELAVIRGVDTTHEFYFHPSITNRIASLGWSEKTRFKKWYFEL
jgi:Zn-dependent protease with chaperone function